jgi:ferredoxin
VLGQPGSRYARRRDGAFVIAVNCTEPGETCFCASMGTGPGVSGHSAGDTGSAGFRGDDPPGTPRYDLALTELADQDAHRFVVEAGSERGADMLARVPSEAATEDVVQRARSEVNAAAGRMGRQLDAGGLHELMAGSHGAARWDDVAARCLTCGNCTMACPTCFCTSVEDSTDLTGDHAERWEYWASCFDLDFSYLHGGSVRPSARSRYRQWLTHKLGTWHDQFGSSGCVGCGRCIVWCPVGIDLTEEVRALYAEQEES